MTFFEIINSIFRKSKRIHLSHSRVENLREMIYLIDRFLDDALEYELEWDDFVSWKNENQSVEEFRDKIADLERLFFSNDPSDRIQAKNEIVNYRNTAASLISISLRNFGSGDVVDGAA